MRNLLLGFGLGIAATLTLVAATSAVAGKYQLAVTYEPDRSRVVFARINTATGVIDACERPATSIAASFEGSTIKQ